MHTSKDAMTHTLETSNSHPPTPALVLDVPKLEGFVTRLQDAVDTHWPNAILSYSFKTNPLPWLIGFMRDRGLWAEVVSDTEYQLAIALGYSPEHIIYNGPIKSHQQLWSALREGSIINLDAKREVSWTAEFATRMPDASLAVGLRVNWDLEAYCPGQSTNGLEHSRFGFNAENGELDAAIQELNAAGVRIAGLHMHRNSATQSVDVYRAAATVAAEIINSRGLTLDYLDIGGGFYGSMDGAPTFHDYIAAIRKGVENTLDISNTTLILEPGGSLVAVPVEMHASVIDVKSVCSTTFIVADASRTNIDPLFRRKKPFEYCLETTAQTTRPEQVISGFTCMEDDRLMTLHDQPALSVGDRVVFYKVGGYTMSFQPTLFIEPPPPVYARTADRLIQVRQGLELTEYLRGNVWSQNSSSVML